MYTCSWSRIAHGRRSVTPEAACQDHTKEIKDKITSKAVTEKAQYKSATPPFTYSSQEHPLPIHNTTTARNLFFRKKNANNITFSHVLINQQIQLYYTIDLNQYVTLI